MFGKYVTHSVFKFTSLLAAIVLLPQLAFAQSDAAVQDTAKDDVSKNVWSTVNDIWRVANENHLQAPPKQSVILAAARGIYITNGQRPPKTLSAEVSKLATNDAFQKFLSKCWKECGNREIQQRDRDVVYSYVANSIEPGGNWIAPKALRVEKQLSENRYVGIGIQLAFRNNYSVITRPYVGGAARNAGVRAGDMILEIDGESTKGWKLGKVVDELRGLRGTKVSIKVKNEKDGKVQVFDMVRDKIPLPTVSGVRRNDDDSWNFNISKDGKIALLKIERISGSTAAEIKTLAAQIDQQGFEAVVLDFNVAGAVDFHHALLFADAVSDEHDLGTVYSNVRVRQIKTGSDNCLANKKVFVVCNKNVTGPTLMIYNALKKSGAVFVGNGALCSPAVKARLDLPNQKGALGNVTTSVFVPSDEKWLEKMGGEYNRRYGALTPVRFKVDVHCKPEDMLKAIKKQVS